MRGLWSTLALLVVLLGLSAYIYFVTSKKPAADAGETKEKVFASLQADKIDELTVKSESGDSTALKKAEGGWQLVQPVSAHADDSEVSGITSGLASMEIVRIVDENPSDLKEFGLDPPRIDVGYKLAGDKDYRHVLIGEKSPTGADLFAKLQAGKRVFLISASQETALNRSTFDLRDKTLIKFDRDKVDGVDVNQNGRSLAFRKDGSEWKMTKPLDLRADFGSVEALIGRLQTAQMKAIVADPATPADLKKYGLDKPDITVDLAMGSARASLLVGNKTEDNNFDVRDGSKAAVVTTESSLVDELKKGADEYRRKDIFEFRAYNASHLEITRNGQAIVFDKVKGENDAPDKWRRASPNPGDVDRDKMDSFMSKLAGLRASSFVEQTAKTGLQSPVATVVAKFDDGKKQEQATFGKADKDAYAARPGEPGAAKIDAADFDEAMKDLDGIAK